MRLIRRRTFTLLLLSGLAGVSAAQDGEESGFAKVPAGRLEGDLRVVHDEPTVACRVGPIDVRCRSTTYGFLLEHLSLAARALELLGLEKTGRYAIAPAGGEAGSFTVDDGAGATATCDRLWQPDGALLVSARGKLDVPVLPTVHGTGLILVRWAPRRDDPTLLAARCEVRFRLDSKLLHAATAPFRKALGRVLEEKLALLIASAAALAERVDRDPWSVHAALVKDGKAAPADLEAYRARLLLH